MGNLNFKTKLTPDEIDVIHDRLKKLEMIPCDKIEVEFDARYPLYRLVFVRDDEQLDMVVKSDRPLDTRAIKIQLKNLFEEVE